MAAVDLARRVADAGVDRIVYTDVPGTELLAVSTSSRPARLPENQERGSLRPAASRRLTTSGFCRAQKHVESIA